MRRLPSAFPRQKYSERPSEDESARLKAHLECLRKGTSRPFADSRRVSTALRVRLFVEEMLFALDFPPDESICIARVVPPDESAFRVQPAERPWRYLEGPPEAFSPVRSQRLISAVGRLVLVGDGADLLRSAKWAAAPPDAMILTDAPAFPAMRKRIHGKFGIAPRLGLPGRTGWLAFSSAADGIYSMLHRGVSWRLLDRFRAPVPPEHAGDLFFAGEDFAPISTGLRAVREHESDGGVSSADFRFRTPGLPDIALPFPDGSLMDLSEFHDILATFPLLDYRVRLDADGLELCVWPVPEDTPPEILETLDQVLSARFPLRRVRAMQPDDALRPRYSVADDLQVPMVFLSHFLDTEKTPEVRSGFRRVLRVRAGRFSGKSLLLQSSDENALTVLEKAFREGLDDDTARLLLYGLQPETIPVATPVVPCPSDTPWRPIAIDASSCNGCGGCVSACPFSCFSLSDNELRFHEEACIRCYRCVEVCPETALRPMASETALLSGPALRPALERFVSDDASDATKAPPCKERKRDLPRKPLVILGLAMVTTMEHAAALLVDGRLVAAVEEERFSRIRHHPWRFPALPDVSPASSPLVSVEDAWPVRSIDAVLKMAGLEREDVDFTSINGLPYRFRQSYGRRSPLRPPAILRSGERFFVPHHLAHAACAYGLSGFDECAVLSVDGRGDRETAAFFLAKDGHLERVWDEPFFPDRSIGGVYETVTEILGFGSHGQGSTMALAAFGKPSLSFKDGLSFDGERFRLSEWAAFRRFHRLRANGESLHPEHADLAASVQAALEEAVMERLAHDRARHGFERLCLSGGAALNCQMNGRIRKEMPVSLFVPPGANDAGTAMGAAFLAHRAVTGAFPFQDIRHTFLGPEYSDEFIRHFLLKSGISHSVPDDPAREAARLLSTGRVVCWFQGCAEFGPRALGGRSILADPRKPESKDRLNRMKRRQPWRPVSPSILAGHEADWFETPMDSPFMLIALPMRKDRSSRVPAVVHEDGTCRPQSVHASSAPRYHALLEAFHRETGVPLVANTSFNRRGEPLVNTPAEALRCFAALGADALLLGPCLIFAEAFRR